MYETYVGTLAWRSLTLVPLSDYRVASVHVNDIKAVSNVFAAPLAHSRVCAFNSQNSSSSVFFNSDYSKKERIWIAVPGLVQSGVQNGQNGFEDGL